MRPHTSFLLRCWNIGQRDERIEIEHVQHDSKIVVRSMSAAVAWIAAIHTGDEGPGDGPTNDDRTTGGPT